ncbi:MAG: energy transducer TonB [Opitutaceae bacterium]
MAPIRKGFSSNKKSSKVLVVTLGIGVSAILFVAIPLTQIFTEYDRSNNEIDSIEYAPPPPPPVEEEPPPPPPPEEEPPPPEFEPPPPPISLEQLEIALEAGTGEAVSGDFAMPNLTIQKDELGGLDIFDINDLDKQPKTVKQIPPIYPISAKRRGLSGVVSAEFIIDERGNVVSVKITRSTDPVFEGPTIDALRQWKFTPGEKNGKIVQTRARTKLPYNIQ